MPGAKKFDVCVLMTGRLPDMKPFIHQLQSACHYVKAAAAWLSGQTPPKHEDNEQTIDELRGRIRETVAFAESIKEARYAGASERKVSLSWALGGPLLAPSAAWFKPLYPNYQLLVVVSARELECRLRQSLSLCPTCLPRNSGKTNMLSCPRWSMNDG
jgi:hypothetical protein